MKTLILTILAILLYTTSLLGQSSYAPDSVKYVTEEDIAYKLHEETNYFFKLAPLAYEHKLGEAFSLSAVMKSSSVLNDNFLSGNLSLGIEGRYYYQMKERVKAGKQASNLSGRYISITPKVGFGVNSLNNNNTLIYGLAYGANLAWAEQNRIYDYFYWDSGIEFSYTELDNNFSTGDFTVLSLFRKSDFGVVFGGGGKFIPDKTNTQPQMKVNVNERFALRIIDNNNYSVSRITREGLDDPFWQFLAIPNIISEVKLGNSAFSIVHDFTARVEFSNYQNGVKSDFEADRVLYSLKMGTRWYYKMKSNVLAGKQGNNFSGGYVVANFAHNNTIEKGSDLFFVTAGWGYQKEVGKKFFINVDLTIAALVDGVRPTSNLNGPTNLPGGNFTINIGRRIF